MEENVLKKSIICILLSAVCVLSLLSAVTLTAAAKAEFEMEIPYGHATVDGVISEGEYQVSYVMDKNSAAAWVGTVGRDKVTWYLAWDENGLYYAGTINDRTQTYRDKDDIWVGIDCLELAINPGEVLSGDVTEGIFFSFGAAADGDVVAYRHNYADGFVSDKVTAKSVDHVAGKTSYTIEVFIPWELVQLDTDCTIGGKTDIHLDSTGFEPKAGAVLGLLPCAIDSHDEDKPSNISAAFKFNGTDFMVGDFVHATLMASPETEAPTEAPTEAMTEVTTEVTTEVPTEAPTEVPTESEKSGCKSVCVCGLPVVLLAGWALTKKRRG